MEKYYQGIASMGRSESLGNSLMLKEVAELGIELGPDENFDYEEEGDNGDDDDREDGSDDDDDDYDADDAVDDDGEIKSSSDFNESGDEELDAKSIALRKSNNNRANIKVSKSGLIKRKTTKKCVMHRLHEFASQ
jgi:hypothetical protein